MRQIRQMPGQIDSKFLGPLFKSGQRVFLHGQSAVPQALLKLVVDSTAAVPDLEFMHLHLEGEAYHARAEFRNRIRINNLFVGASIRKCLDYDRIDYTPMFLSEMPKVIKSRKKAVDVALVQVSPPDRFGFCSLGIGVDIARAAVDTASVVLAQVNSKMPRTFGDTLIPLHKITGIMESSEILPQTGGLSKEESKVLQDIGKNVASLVEDGATLQVGIGSIPNAVLRELSTHQHLGVHSELWSDGMVELIEKGVVDNSQKVVHPGKSISSFLQGTNRIFDFAHENPSVELYPGDYVNSPLVIARNPKVTAINSAVEVDLTGQVCSDSVGHRLISGVGGQIDFIRGASLSEGGKSIIAITSRTKEGRSRIVASLNSGAGVVTTRADVHFIVTEYGVADLYGKTLGQRAKALIQISHPEDREKLERAWSEIRLGGPQ